MGVAPKQCTMALWTKSPEPSSIATLTIIGSFSLALLPWYKQQQHKPSPLRNPKKGQALLGL
jgi:hypothetical protein